MPQLTLPQFATFLVTSGPSRVTKVHEARRAHDGPASYPASDHYIHLRAPLREALLSAGDPQPLVQVVASLQDPKKRASHREIVDGLTKVFRTTALEGRTVAKRAWVHGDLTVNVNPTARLLIDDQWHVAYVHLNKGPLDARTVQPALELLRLTHGDLGSPLIIDARRAKLHRPSRSARTRRDLEALLNAEAESFLTLWYGIEGVA